MTLDHTDYRRLFLLSIIAGAVIIFLVNLISDNLYHQLSVVFIMIAYVGYYQSTDKEGKYRNQFADSVYYLGFIFTLISLGFSLLLLESSENMKPIVVLSSFGVALTTTIFGLIVRAYYTQFSSGSEEELLDANRALVDTARQFSISISRFSQDIEAAHNTIEKSNQQFIESQKEHLNKIYSTILDEIKDGFVTSLSEISALVYESWKALDLQLDNLNKTSERGNRILSESIEVFDNEYKQHSRVFSKYNQDMQDFLNTIESFKDNANEMNASVSNISDASKILGELNIDTKSINASFEELNTVLKKVNAKIDSNTSATQVVSSKLIIELHKSTELTLKMHDAIVQSTRAIIKKVK